MRIAQITYSTKPRGGVVHTLALAEALAARGHQVTVWTLGRGGDDAFFRPVDPTVEVRLVPFVPRDDENVGDRIERSIQTMAGAFDPSGYDVVHAQDCISANAVGPCVRTIHHLDEFTTPRLVECHLRAITDPIARLCVSRAVAQEVHEGYGLAPTVIPNGVDADRFARAAGPDGARSRARWQAELGRYVLALGGIEPRKGSIDLLEAFALLCADHPDLSLVIAGGETLFDYRPYRDRFDRRCTELGVEPVVLGTLADDDVPPLVAAAAALGFVSTKEGFGLAAMEALAAGVPVVARDLPVTREVFGDTVTYAANVPQIAAALAAVLDDPTPADAKPGRELAERHTWAAAAAAHERFYEHVAREGGDDGQEIDLTDRQRARRG
ncbi:MSMEG_0565 family glycosyltransferase [Myceligenerans pegani]|uniref:MSMEG_0565 family glycosyltransferase n=1 Tax=Myceligenerans pegani TaxID=2776917 RepID=A0ABR9MVK1_9MICO|nr:MSMEG_0565 family glycosyltransferase [Myceligenerans sp. TRM 65318]MBE1875412.1 MSMEG_0565 family glycosyltransferase [Myceligenerans sp. TRM 65318]MBE3017683.1 MSMEG_0565 family glycosyltransferase [Myceligenerans sp. TRM 65318]